MKTKRKRRKRRKKKRKLKRRKKRFTGTPGRDTKRPERREGLKGGDVKDRK